MRSISTKRVRFRRAATSDPLRLDPSSHPRARVLSRLSLLRSMVDHADTFERVFSELKSGGTRVLPILYNDESGQKTLLAKLRRLFASPSAQQRLISQMIQLAVDHDLDGWNLDFGGCNSVSLPL